jgi:integrase
LRRPAVQEIATMTARHSTRTKRTRKPTKPEKPAASFTDPTLPYPLTVNPCGYYSKKIIGRVHYFGRWDEGPEEAEKRYNKERADREAGREPRTDQDDGPLTVRKLCTDFRNHKRRLMERGDITERTHHDIRCTCDFLSDHFGKGRLVSDLGPRDFQKIMDVLAKQKREGKKKSLVVLGNWVVRIRSVFKYAVDELGAAPVKFGVEFKKPKAAKVQGQKQEKVEEEGERTFTREEITRMLAKTEQPLRSMILLAINCGLGNSDIGQLKLAHLDLDRRWLNYPRPKTKLPRKCWLWAETVDALREWLTQRPEPKDQADAKLVFITKYGQSWHKEVLGSPVSAEFAKLLKDLDINGSRGFYNLRATFRTEAGPCRDLEALFYAMGHKLPGMAADYVKYIQPDRLQRVAETVHERLCPAPKK